MVFTAVKFSVKDIFIAATVLRNFWPPKHQDHGKRFASNMICPFAGRKW